MSMTMLEAALGYIERGWSVMPVNRTGTKVPLVKWTELQERIATREEVIEWWTRWPEANIGVITGSISGIVAIDIDTRKGAEVAPVLAVAPTEFINRTGSGGAHLLYEYPYEVEEGVRTRANLMKGVDVRSDGGYIVVPPSIHANGTPYEWDSEGDPSSLPPEVIEFINDDGGETRNPSGDPDWVSRLLDEGAEEGGRNDAATRLVGYLEAKGIPKDITYTMVEQWNGSKVSPPLSQREVRTIVESVYRTARRKDGKKKGSVGSDKPDGPRLAFLPFSDYMEEHADALVEWTVDGWLPQATIAFLVAAPESYKTWMLLDLAVSVAGGKPFLGMFEVKKPGPVLLIQQEDFHGGLAQRFGVITFGKYSLSFDSERDTFSVPLVPTLPIYVHPDRNLRFDDVNVMDELEAVIAQLKPSVVIIDPLYSAASNDDYMAKSVQHMFRLKAMRDKYGCTFVLAHHTKKGSTETTEREGGWGSQFLNAFLETGWQIRRIKEMKNAVVVRRHFKVTESKEETHLRFNISTDVAPFKYEVVLTVPESVGKSEAIVNLLLKEGPQTPTEVAAKLSQHRTTISRTFKQLEKDGMVLKDKEGKYTLANQEIEF